MLRERCPACGDIVELQVQDGERAWMQRQPDGPALFLIEHRVVHTCSSDSASVDVTE